MSNFKKGFTDYLKHNIYRDLFSDIRGHSHPCYQKDYEYIQWVSCELINLVKKFVKTNDLLSSEFVVTINKAFGSSRFNSFLQKRIIEYLSELFSIFYDSLLDGDSLSLEDNSLNRYAVKEYKSKFGITPKIKWRMPQSMLQRILSIFIGIAAILYLSLNRGLRIFNNRKKYKVMRELVWGLFDSQGFYLHDDFFVNGKNINSNELLLFSRGIRGNDRREKAYEDVRKSNYAYFELHSLPIAIEPLFNRIIPKYIFSGGRALFLNITSPNYSLFFSIFKHFIYCAIHYEKVFSNFDITAELGHNYFSSDHVAEAMISQNYGTRYYLMQLSDSSMRVNQNILSFLGCDRFLTWGKAYVHGSERDSDIFTPTGYIFKKFIREVASNKDKVLSKMGIKAKGKIVTFFDESFGDDCNMTEEHFLNFWETIFRFAKRDKNNTVVIKPKKAFREIKLSARFSENFLRISQEVEKEANVYILDPMKWSFIEAIGIADIVITQGMTTSSTIAIVCGIEGLYLNQANYDHKFWRLFKDRIAFDDSDKLLDMIEGIVTGRESPLRDIPERLMRDFDEYPDDAAVGRLQDILIGKYN